MKLLVFQIKFTNISLIKYLFLSLLPVYLKQKKINIVQLKKP